MGLFLRSTFGPSPDRSGRISPCLLCLGPGCWVSGRATTFIAASTFQRRQGRPSMLLPMGVVRLAGKYEFYSDPLVQLRHYRPQNSKAGGYYYTNYMHLSAVSVAEGDRISRGQLLGYSGRSNSGYAHLHFEVRDGGIYQQHCINPLLILPYEDRHRPTVRIDKVDIAKPDSAAVQVTVTMSAEEPDLNRVELALYRRQGSELKEIVRRAYDMMDWNRKFTPKKDPTKLLDNPDFNDVQLHPAPFGASSGAYSLTLTFTGLGRIATQPGLVVTVVAVDVRGNGVEATHQ